MPLARLHEPHGGEITLLSHKMSSIQPECTKRSCIIRLAKSIQQEDGFQLPRLTALAASAQSKYRDVLFHYSNKYASYDL